MGSIVCCPAQGLGTIGTPQQSFTVSLKLTFYIQVMQVTIQNCSLLLQEAHTKKTLILNVRSRHVHPPACQKIKTTLCILSVHLSLLHPSVHIGSAWALILCFHYKDKYAELRETPSPAGQSVHSAGGGLEIGIGARLWSQIALPLYSTWSRPGTRDWQLCS